MRAIIWQSFKIVILIELEKHGVHLIYACMWKILDSQILGINAKEYIDKLSRKTRFKEKKAHSLSQAA